MKMQELATRILREHDNIFGIRNALEVTDVLV
jgi:hypothetical protein